MSRRPRRRSAARKRSGKGHGSTILGIAGLGVVLAAMAAGLVFLFVKSGETVELDPDTNCPVAGPSSATAFLFDTTDPLSEVTLSDLKNHFRTEGSKVGPGGYIRIVSLTAEPGEVVTLFDGCNPGDGSTVDIWTSNPKRQQKKWEEEFGKPLEKLPDEVANGSSADQSPIMAAIQQVKLTLFDAEISRKAAKRLIVASDMIEHTSLYSQYRSSLDYGAFKESKAAQIYGTSLDGIAVKVLYVNREKKAFSSREHVEFWATWVRDEGGDWEEAEKLEGLN